MVKSFLSVVQTTIGGMVCLSVVMSTLIATVIVTATSNKYIFTAGANVCTILGNAVELQIKVLMTNVVDLAQLQGHHTLLTTELPKVTDKPGPECLSSHCSPMLSDSGGSFATESVRRNDSLTRKKRPDSTFLSRSSLSFVLRDSTPTR